MLRLSSLIFGRSWILLLPAVLALSWYRVEDLHVAHQEIWRLTQRYVAMRQQLKQIRTDSLKHVRVERQ